MSRVRFVTGRQKPRAKIVTDGFTAKYSGTCRRCGGPFNPGDRIHSPGKGMGACHVGCRKMKASRKRKRGGFTAPAGATCRRCGQVFVEGDRARKNVYGDVIHYECERAS